jgi:hypothetical protein
MRRRCLAEVVGIGMGCRECAAVGQAVRVMVGAWEVQFRGCVDLYGGCV